MDSDYCELYNMRININTVRCRCNARYNITWYCSDWGGILIRVWTHKRHPIARPNRRAMGCLCDNFGENWPCCIGATLYYDKIILTQRLHVAMWNLGNHWFRWSLGIYLVPSQCLKHLLIITNLSSFNILIIVLLISPTRRTDMYVYICCKIWLIEQVSMEVADAPAVIQCQGICSHDGNFLCS